MGKKGQSLVVLLLFAAVRMAAGMIVVSPVYAAERTQAQTSLSEWFALSRLLTSEERQSLASALDEILVKEKNVPVLRELAEQIRHKVKNDTDGLRYLLVNIKKLADDSYAHRIQPIKTSLLRDCCAMADQLKQQVEDVTDPFMPDAKGRYAEDYLRRIKAFGDFLIPGRAEVTVPELWQEIKEVVKPGYRDWLKRYILLRNKLQLQKSSLDSLDNLYTFEEEEFIRKFGDVQAGLRKFSRPDSDDF